MRQSRLFTKTRREAPSDEVAKNAQLLIRAGYIHKEMAGVYSYLPLGLRVLNRIVGIIREEMNALGGQEVHLAALQRSDSWIKTGRWQDDVIDIWFKTKLKDGAEIGLANTHEEPLAAVMQGHVTSYKDLPVCAYQFQTKFRNELRAKSGILRTREFLMKDLYSFSKDENEHVEFYEKAKRAYQSIFERVGLGEHTHLTFASGGSFSKFSHEFQTRTDAGEDVIYISRENGMAINKEVFTEDVKKDLGIEGSFEEAKAIEVGNIFTLGTKFSEALGLTYRNSEGKDVPVFMGSYGIGPGRVMGALVEVFGDDKGIAWPESVAPFLVHLVPVVPDPTVVAYADALYDELVGAGVAVLYDDRDLRAGEKLADADLIGIPARVVIGKNTLETGKLESTYRRTGETKLVSREELVNFAKGVQERHG